MSKKYVINGYDRLFGEWYELPQKYDSRKDAENRCRSNEWVEVVDGDLE